MPEPLRDPGSTAPGHAWRPRDVAAATAFAAFLAVQLALPIRALLADGPNPARFGWQMFATLPWVPQVEAELDSGTRTPMDLRLVVGYPRAEMAYDDRLVPALCRALPEARSLMVRWHRGGEAERYRCR